MAEEIANPERLQSGTLDFAFVSLFLLPLLLLVLLYNIKGSEAEQGFLQLIYVQTGDQNGWLIARIAFYASMLSVVLLGLILYGAQLTNVWSVSAVFFKVFLWLLAYLFLWLFCYFLILRYGNSTVSNTLKMIGVWLLFAFIIPATVHQWVSIEKPTNLMTDFIDLKRDGLSQFSEEEDRVLKEKVFDLYPELETSTVAKAQVSLDNTKKRYSSGALLNEVLKEHIREMEQEYQAKNNLIQGTYWFNPLTFFQNQLNSLAQTQYEDYQVYRDEIQKRVDRRIEIMVVDIWKEVEVDKQRYLEYNSLLN